MAPNRIESIEEAGNVQSKPTLQEDLHDCLDALWQRYLATLDQYHTAQGELQKQCAAGFFSLTQAKFKAQNGRRYGQDSYDERMKASRLAVVTDTDNSYELEITNSAATPATTETGSASKGSDDDGEKQEPTPPDTPVPEDGKAQPSSDENKSACLDPIRMFGILVPPALRSAQGSFSAAFETPVANAVNAARGMREIEGEIRKLRKTIKKAEKATTQNL